MPFDSVVLSAVASEVRRSLRDGQITRIYQPSPYEAILHFRAGGERRLLLISAHPERFRLHLLGEAPENPASPPQFCMVLRKHLEGARLIGIERDGWERVLHFRFSRSDGERELIAEMMGKHSNLVLVDDGGQILDAIKHVSGRLNRVRELLPQRPYIHPPPQPRLDPSKATRLDMRQALATLGDRVDERQIVRTFANVGPFLAREVLLRAESPGPANVADALADMAERTAGEAFAPVLMLDEGGQPADSWAFECLSLPPDRQDAAPSMSVALEVGGRFGARASDVERLCAEVRARLDALREREERRLCELAAAREAAERADDYRIMGELIQAHVGSLTRGQATIELPNYYDPEGALLRIALDSTLSPQENAEAYFRRHRKARQSVPILEGRIAEARLKRQEWHDLWEEAATAGEERLMAIAGMTERTSGLERSKAAGAEPTGLAEAQRRPGPGVRRTLSSDGYEIWYGEHREGNDTLTFRLAASTDLWLHVRAGASAHVVIRTGKKPDEVPRRTLLEAARIAVAHSESKHAGITAVDYTLKKYVRKRKGAGPGQALYTHERTLHIEAES